MRGGRFGTFGVLFRTFVEQFFTSDSVSSDVQLRQTIIAVLAFILTPCLLILIGVFPQFQLLVIRVGRIHPPPGVIVRATAVRNMMAEDMLEWTVSILVGYSMIVVGLAAVFAWDALSFDRRDAMVFGPLPVRGRTIVTAKLAALAAFLLVASVGVNTLNAAVFAIETSDQFGTAALIGHFVGCLVVTSAAAALVFGSIVTIRGVVAIIGGRRLAAAAGSVLQSAFVLALLVLLIGVFAPPARPGHITVPDTATQPMTWFVAWFEVLRRSDRGSWPEFAALSHRAILALPLIVCGAVLSSALAFRRQMQHTLTPLASAGPLGRARFCGAVARALAGRDPVARATADFILFTIFRNRTQQAPIAMGGAVALGFVVLGLARTQSDITPVLLGIPLLIAYWSAIGMRASFFFPSELPASWTFRSNAPATGVSYPAAVRASVIAIIGPPAVALGAGIGAAVAGASGALRHAAVLLVAVWLLAELVVLTVDFIPFTNAYRPGHAKLKTRWPLYIVGAYLFGSLLVRVELACSDVWSFLTLLACGGAVILAGEMTWRRRAARWSANAGEEFADDDGDIAVLHIGQVVHGAHVSG
jgi:hypothetical protein